MPAKKTDSRSINNWVHALAASLAKGAMRYYNAEFGVKLPEMRILSALAQNGPITARDLVGITAMDKALISRVLSKLSSDGLISQKSQEGRIRLLQWYLTAEGEHLVSRLKPEWENREEIIQADLSANEKRLLKDMLHRMFEASERLYAEETMTIKRAPHGDAASDENDPLD